MSVKQRVSPKEALAALAAERRTLCVDLALIAERLMRAGLIRTAHRCNDAVQEIGWEVVRLEAKGKRAPR